MTHTLSIERIDGFEPGLTAMTRRGQYTEPALSPAARETIRRVFGSDLNAREVVDRIVGDVRLDGDAAVRRYTEALDGMAPDRVEVPRERWEDAAATQDPAFLAALETAAERIRAFHERQPSHAWFDQTELGTFGQMIRPLDRVGIYTPGGSAAYPSSLLMVAIPAHVAGVREIVIAAPPGRDGHISPAILSAALVAGVDRVFAIGGAQAIAALAFGTETVPQVDKILGPGNIFVTLAKQRVYGVVDIDQMAGPTETLVVADDSADPVIVAADLVAQAEHDPQASAVLITTCRALADRIPALVAEQAAELEREDIVRASMDRNGRIILVNSVDEAVAISNAWAPEHLCLLVRDPWGVLPQVRNAGGVFIGEDSPEALGDYTAGPSHVMPTGGTARYSSPVNVGEFVKVISLYGANRRAVETLAVATIRLAEVEGLTGHAAAIRRRITQHPGNDRMST